MTSFFLKKENMLYVMSLPLSVLIPVVALLLYNHESLISIVSIALYVVVAIITIPVMAIMSRYTENYKHIILSLIIFLFIYVMFFPTQAPKSEYIPFGSVGFTVVIITILTILFTFLKEHIERLVFIILIVTLVVTIVIPDRSERKIQIDEYELSNQELSNEKQRYIHIILDQHIGLEGITVDDQNDEMYVDGLVDSYINYEFDLYSKAYTKFYQTKLSIPSILNFSSTNEVFINNYDLEPPLIKLKKNKLFDYLANNNYRINVYGDYLGWCDSIYPIKKCVRYRRTILFNETESNLNKIFLVIDNLLQRYRLLNIYRKLSESKLGVYAFLPKYNWNPPVVDSHTSASLDVFEILKNDILNSKQGEAFFAHLVFPHSPYLYNKNCDLIYLHGFHKNNVPYDRYLSQVKCSQKKVIELIELMNEAGILRDSVVVIHSDHGPYDLIDNDKDERKWRKYSAFFVVHTPEKEKKINHKLYNDYFTVSSILGSLFVNNLKRVDNEALIEQSRNTKSVYVLDAQTLRVNDLLLEDFSKGHTKN